jgi:hypothetical protein
MAKKSVLVNFFSIAIVNGMTGKVLPVGASAKRRIKMIVEVNTLGDLIKII